MFSILKVAAAAAIAVASWGCGSTQQAAEPPAEPSPALACVKCETTWVKVPVRGKANRVVAYSTRKEMHCPDCISAAENFFVTGRLQHTCATCGPDAMKICSAH